MTDQQNAALEPCPFCGGEAEQGQNADTCGEAVHCITCGAEGKQFHPTEYGYTFGDDAQAYAVAYEAAVSAAILAWNTRPAPAGAEAVREALTGCMAALKSARSWFETIAEAPEDEADGFVEEAKNVVDAAYFNADCALDALTAAKAPSTGEVCAVCGEPSSHLDHCVQNSRSHYYQPTPQPAPTAAEDGLREALEAKIASLEASIKGKEAIIYGLLTKGTNQ